MSEGQSTWKRVLAWMACHRGGDDGAVHLSCARRLHVERLCLPAGPRGRGSRPPRVRLPGHLLTTWEPLLGHVLAPVTFLIGGYFAAKYMRRRWPLTLSQLLALLSVVFVVAMCVATATRSRAT